MLSNLSTDNATGKAFYEAANKDRESYIKAAFNEVMFRHLPLEQGLDVLGQLIKKSVEANKAN